MSLFLIKYYAFTFLAPLFVTWIYLLPSGVAIKRNHRSVGKISLLNIFLGWTIFIWVITFFWSFNSNSRSS